MKTVFFTGAGISAESGIRTYRGTDGIYNNTSIEDVLDVDVYRTNPERVHAILDPMLEIVRDAQPNAAHLAIAEYCKTHPDTVVVTQNVDDLFEKAGVEDVIHLHGKINQFVCLTCGIVDRKYAHPGNCLNCGDPMRYDIVLFGELAPEYQTFNRVLNTLHEGDAFVAIGTSGIVIPLNKIVKRFKHKGVNTYLNNLDRTMEVTESLFTRTFQGRATEQVPKICSMLQGYAGIV